MFPHTYLEELTGESGEKPSILNIKYKSLFKDIGFILVLLIEMLFLLITFI
jgi:hypothetical protein